MRIWGWIPLVAVLGCGSDNGSSGASSEATQACTDLSAKFATCHLVANGACNTGDPCVVECAAHAECAQLTAPSPTGSYLQCVAACSGAMPGDFICANGTMFVPKVERCDGHPQCQDLSDEANCGKDAGTD